MAKKQPILKRLYINGQKSWKDGIKTPGQRIFAHIDAHLGDHTFLRLAWHNLHKLDDGVWRCNQPTPGRLKRYRDRMGVKTVVNLRGPSRWGSYILEKEACERLGLTMINHRMYSRRMPSYEEILDVKALLESIEGPFIFHCKSGADRAGIFSALYVLLVKNGTPEEAQAELSLRYLHIKQAKTGRLDHFIAAYQKFNAQQPTPFLEWARDHYDRKKLTAEFHEGGFGNWFVEKVLHRE